MAITYTLLPYALTTLDRAKDHLKVPDAETSADNRIKRHINAATEMLESYTDRFLKERTGLEDYQSGRRNDRILLPQWPLNVVTELWVDSSSLFTNTDNIVDPTKYRIETDSRGRGVGIVLLGGCLFPKGTQNIKIVYDGGFQTVPADLEEVCLFMTEYLFEIRDENRIGEIQKSKNQENITYLEDFPLWVRNTIERYARSPLENLANVAVTNG